MLPTRIREALARLITDELHGQLDRTNITQAEPVIAAMLTREVEAFDAEIGDQIQSICPDPGSLKIEQARVLAQSHIAELLPAFNGTTLAAALVNVTHRFCWGLGVGDSSVGV